MEQNVNEPSRIQSTIGVRDLPSKRLDVLVVGAGPAGVAAALTARRSGLAVLLVDRAAFPRDKVCGCCLNQSALATLESLGALQTIQQLGAQAITRFALGAAGHVANIPIQPGLAVSRSAMDAALIQLAISQGVQFMSRTVATDDQGVFALRGLDDDHPPIGVRPGVAVVADGLRGRTVADSPSAARRSRIGVGAVLDSDTRFTPGVVYMATSSAGYAGAVVLEDGRLDIAGAFVPEALRSFEHIGLAVNHTMQQAGLPALRDVDQMPWRGTAALSRRRRQVWQSGVLFAGDAAGYVEPFTGEGMAWALGSGQAAAQLIGQAGGRWSVALGRQWQRQYQQISNRQRTCRRLALLLKSRAITRVAVKLLTIQPSWARPIVSGLNHRLEWSEPHPRSLTS